MMNNINKMIWKVLILLILLILIISLGLIIVLNGERILGAGEDSGKSIIWNMLTVFFIYFNVKNML